MVLRMVRVRPFTDRFRTCPTTLGRESFGAVFSNRKLQRLMVNSPRILGTNQAPPTSSSVIHNGLATCWKLFNLVSISSSAKCMHPHIFPHVLSPPLHLKVCLSMLSTHCPSFNSAISLSHYGFLYTHFSFRPILHKIFLNSFSSLV